MGALGEQRRDGGEPAAISFRPATAERWRDVEALFGDKGACGGCWCMTWRRTPAEFTANKGAGNRKALRVLVESATPPGLLAYAGDEPVGWCALAPREEYPRLARSRVLAPVDDQPVWSVTCFFVTRAHRRTGLSRRLLAAAVEQARTLGARIVEGYPSEPYSERMPDAFAWTGMASTFRAVGFVEAARRSKARPVMRLVLDGKRRRAR